MVLGYHGIAVAESELRRQASFLPGGVHITEVERLARAYGLRANVRKVTPTAIGEFIAKGSYSIAFGLFPRVGELAFHAVVPVKVSKSFVTVLDPLLGECRLLRNEFTAARRWQSHLAVVADRPQSSS